MKIVALGYFILLSASAAADPDCSGIERWPTKMAFVHLKNAGLADNSELDWKSTTTVRIASEKIGKDLYRQVHRITFKERSGADIEVIAVSNASSEECSESGVEISVVSKDLGP